jgi:hypothetical protein
MSTALKAVIRSALWFCACNLLTAQCTNPTQVCSTIPFNAKVNVVVASSFFRLTDANGAAFAASGAAAVPLSVPSGQAPPTLRLVVSGRR